MGVTGLWNGWKRGYRVGIDASIWFFHAGVRYGGENPELRTLFFRCCRLLALPILPVFVFDGPGRPDEKRGKRLGKNEHWLVQGMKDLIDAFGFEWWTAPGEAEAELAVLNASGELDAILTDDVDTFLFGAEVVIRNPSVSLAGTMAHARQTGAANDDLHVIVYQARDVKTHPDVLLDRAGMILIGLMAGGDYSPGLKGIGIKVSTALAGCGYGDLCLDGVASSPGDNDLSSFLLDWRGALRAALSSPSDVTLLLKRSYAAAANAITDDFPSLKVLSCYTEPTTSQTAAGLSHSIVWRRKLSLTKIAAICEQRFEWGRKDRILKKAKGNLWKGAVLRLLRDEVLTKDAVRLGVPSPPALSSSSERPFTTISNVSIAQLVVSICSSREHASTDGLLEYRLEINPLQL